MPHPGAETAQFCRLVAHSRVLRTHGFAFTILRSGLVIEMQVDVANADRVGMLADHIA